LPDGQEKLTEARGLSDLPGERSPGIFMFETALTRLLTMREMDVLILRGCVSDPHRCVTASPLSLEERALARVSKDGAQHGICGHPSRRIA
jgi:hypothetical protein